MELEQPTEYTTVEYLANAVDEEKLVRWSGGNPRKIEWAVLVANSQVHLSVKLPAGTAIPPALTDIANKIAKFHLASLHPPVEADILNDYNASLTALSTIVTSGLVITASETVGAIEGDLTRDDIDDDLEGMANVIPLGDLSQ